MSRLRTIPAIALLWCAGASAALSQQPPTAIPNPEIAPPHLDSKACADRERATVGGGTGLQLPKPEKPPSDRLARTDGVICPPPDIDPDIRAPAPGGGMTPVIPPPGSPGGDPTQRPK